MDCLTPAGTARGPTAPICRFAPISIPEAASNQPRHPRGRYVADSWRAPRSHGVESPSFRGDRSGRSFPTGALDGRAGNGQSGVRFTASRVASARPCEAALGHLSPSRAKTRLVNLQLTSRRSRVSPRTGCSRHGSQRRANPGAPIAQSVHAIASSWMCNEINEVGQSDNPELCRVANSPQWGSETRSARVEYISASLRGPMTSESSGLGKRKLRVPARRRKSCDRGCALIECAPRAGLIALVKSNRPSTAPGHTKK